MEDELERSFPVGVVRRRVWICGDWFAFRKVDRGLVKSMAGYEYGRESGRGSKFSCSLAMMDRRVQR